MLTASASVPPPKYSLDTCGVFSLYRHYPPDTDMFERVWYLVEDLIWTGRLRACQQVRDECGEGEFSGIFTHHEEMVVDFGELQPYFAAFIDQGARLGIHLPDPDSTQDYADPYVIALALMLEGRDVGDLAKPHSSAGVCKVVSYERKRQNRWTVPGACDAFGLRCVEWPEVFRDVANAGSDGRDPF